jgi:hypothetical protein
MPRATLVEPNHILDILQLMGFWLCAQGNGKPHIGISRLFRAHAPGVMQVPLGYPIARRRMQVILKEGPRDLKQAWAVVDPNWSPIQVLTELGPKMLPDHSWSRFDVARCSLYTAVSFLGTAVHYVTPCSRGSVLCWLRPYSEAAKSNGTYLDVLDLREPLLPELSSSCIVLHLAPRDPHEEDLQVRADWPLESRLLGPLQPQTFQIKYVPVSCFHRRNPGLSSPAPLQYHSLRAHSQMHSWAGTGDHRRPPRT